MNAHASLMATICRALEIYMLSAPDPRPAGGVQVARDLRRPDTEVAGGGVRPEGEAAVAPRAGQPAALLGGSI
jgi:hypothetical protein